jgi:hypothetical protein
MRTHILWIFAAASLFSMAAATYSPAAPLAIFGVGYHNSPPQFPSELFQFSEGGQMSARWDIPQSKLGQSIATLGGILYVAEPSKAIQRYNLAGGFLGQFADVSSQAGASPGTQSLETDSAGNFYSSFAGFQSSPRTSFRLDQAGSVSQTFSHPDLVFPRGIDANANGDVFIVNSAGVGVGNRLFRFSSSGTYISNYAIPQAIDPSDIAIDETRSLLYVADEFGNSILKYDISSGTPTYTGSLSVPGNALDVFVEPMSGRIFGAFYTLETDPNGPFLKLTGFEVARDGSATTLFVEDAVPREQTVRGIVALVIPEPSSGALIIIASSMLLPRRRG